MLKKRLYQEVLQDLSADTVVLKNVAGLKRFQSFKMLRGQKNPVLCKKQDCLTFSNHYHVRQEIATL